MSIGLPVFVGNSTCQLCPLHATCETVGMRSRPLSVPTKVRHPDCILVLGEAPGYQEDVEGLPFVGPSGQLLQKVYLNHFKFQDVADVYLGNAVRCRPPKNATPSTLQVNRCRPYVLDDISMLLQHYKRVIVLAVGATAAQSIGFKSLKKALAFQGSPFPDFPDERVFRFVTYHPAFLMRTPAVGTSVEDHLRFLREWLGGQTHSTIQPEVPLRATPIPSVFPDVVSLDIETYGIVHTQPNQTQFQPVKSLHWDGVHRSHLVQSVALSWWEEGNPVPRSTVLLPSVPADMATLKEWLSRLQANKGTVLGHNIKFDISYLRAAYPLLKQYLRPPLRLMDTQVLSYLGNELRPEKSLKALAPMFNITRYTEEGIKRYRDRFDPGLWTYNAQDTAATLVLASRLLGKLAAYYGAGTAKGTPYCLNWYSDLLWLVNHMEEVGIPLDTEHLRSMLTHYGARRTKLVAGALSKYGLILQGQGSRNAQREVIDAALAELDALSISPPKDLILTNKKQEISFCDHNRAALLNILPPKAPAAVRLRIMGLYQKLSKLLDSYLYPLVEGRGKDHKDPSLLAIRNRVYPNWYPIPSAFEDGSEGGTVQARIVAKKPSIQTFPYRIKSAIKPGPGNGALWFDLSQVELRVAALLSGDPAMMQVFIDDLDAHTATALRIFGADIAKHPEFKKFRQIGKTINFAVLFRAGAHKVSETLLTDSGIDVPIDECQRIIDEFYAKSPKLREWQDSLIEGAHSRGFVELPLIGQSRLFTFKGTRLPNETKEHYWNRLLNSQEINEIVNLPVQATAANVMLSIQVDILKEAERRALPLKVCCNIYDAALLEYPRAHRRTVLAMIDPIIKRPTYLKDLEDLLGRSVPIKYDVSEL